MSAKLELRHLDCRTEKRYITTESIKLETKNGIKINIYEIDSCKIVPIILDIPTAIKFAKTLRTEINKAKEVDNG